MRNGCVRLERCSSDDADGRSRSQEIGVGVKRTTERSVREQAIEILAILASQEVRELCCRTVPGDYNVHARQMAEDALGMPYVDHGASEWKQSYAAAEAWLRMGLE